MFVNINVYILHVIMWYQLWQWDEVFLEKKNWQEMFGFSILYSLYMKQYETLSIEESSTCFSFCNKLSVKQ